MPVRRWPLYMLLVSVLPRSRLGGLISSGDHSSLLYVCRSVHSMVEACVRPPLCKCKAGIITHLSRTEALASSRYGL